MSECDREAATKKRLWFTRSYCGMEKLRFAQGNFIKSFYSDKCDRPGKRVNSSDANGTKNMFSYILLSQ